MLCINTLTKKVEQLERENAEMQSALRNQQQVAHLWKECYKKSEVAMKRAKRDCTNTEQAFENYVNEVETERSLQRMEAGLTRLLDVVKKAS